MYKGISVGAQQDQYSADMTDAVMDRGTSMPSYCQVRMYGPGAREAADERLLEEVKARRAIRIWREPINKPNQPKTHIVEARLWRESLEEELKKAKAIEATLL
ncbi:hypothetical protein DDE82_008704 [Stemphylium lycopersici]|nr:hypothetical protein DDE82_008704 [Stemphylium lycopersici]